jgi:hypothetical protein
MQTYLVELACPECRHGRLAANGEVSDQGNIHVCSACRVKFIVPGEPYPRRVERIDTDAQALRGDTYAPQV